jgi:hypothetical protein
MRRKAREGDDRLRPINRPELPQDHPSDRKERYSHPPNPACSRQGLSKLEGRDGSPTRGRPGHRNGPLRRGGLPGLAFNNPYLQRVYCGLDVLALARDFVSTLLGVIKTGSVDTQHSRRAGGDRTQEGRQGGQDRTGRQGKTGEETLMKTITQIVEMPPRRPPEAHRTASRRRCEIWG